MSIEKLKFWAGRLNSHFPEVHASAVVFVGTMVLNLCNYAFHFLFGRLLGPADYGLLVALNMLVQLLSVPLSAINLLLTQRVAEALPEERPALIYHALRFIARTSLVVLIALALVVLVGGQSIMAFFKTSQLELLLMTVIAIEVGLVLGAFRGIIQGLERFPALSLSLVLEGMSRVAAGWALNQLGVVGVMAALPVSQGVALLACAAPLLWQFGKALPIGSSTWNLKLAPRFLYFVVTLAMLGILTGIDMPIARRLLSPYDAGLFAAMSVLGKVILYFPSAVTYVIFPVVSRRLRHTPADRPIQMLLPTLIITLTASIPFVLLYALAPVPIINILYGAEYPNLAPVLWVYGLATLPMALNLILSQYFLAARHRGLPVLIGLASLAEIVLLYLFHSSLTIMALGVGAAQATLALVLLLLTFRRRSEATSDLAIRVLDPVP